MHVTDFASCLVCGKCSMLLNITMKIMMIMYRQGDNICVWDSILERKIRYGSCLKELKILEGKS